MKAMIRKATPAQSQLPVRNQTTIAMMAAGRKKRKTLAITTITMTPITKRSRSKMTSNSSGRLGRGKGGDIGETFNKFTFLTAHCI